MVFLVKYGQRRLKPVIAVKVEMHTHQQRFTFKKPPPITKTFMSVARYHGVGRVEALKSLIAFQ